MNFRALAMASQVLSEGTMAAPCTDQNSFKVLAALSLLSGLPLAGSCGRNRLFASYLPNLSVPASDRGTFKSPIVSRMLCTTQSCGTCAFNIAWSLSYVQSAWPSKVTMAKEKSEGNKPCGRDQASRLSRARHERNLTCCWGDQKSP